MSIPVLGEIASGMSWLWNRGKDAVDAVGGIADESPSAIKRREMLNEQGANAGNFADMLTGSALGLQQESLGARNNLRDIASGKVSLSREQLRQGLGGNLANMRSMAASASPQNSALAARTAMMAGGRAATGLSGQTAAAGIAERQAAMNGLAQMLTAQSGQAINGVNGSRGNAIQAFGNVTPDKSWLEKYGPMIQAGASLAAGA